MSACSPRSSRRIRRGDATHRRVDHAPNVASSARSRDGVRCDRAESSRVFAQRSAFRVMPTRRCKHAGGDRRHARKTPALSDRGSPPIAAWRSAANARLDRRVIAVWQTRRGIGSAGAARTLSPPIAVHGQILSDRPRWSWRALRASVAETHLPSLEAGACRAPTQHRMVEGPAAWPQRYVIALCARKRKKRAASYRVGTWASRCKSM